MQDIDKHWERLRDQVAVSAPIKTVAALGERSFQIDDPNGVTYRLIQLVS